jgi:hypothetical protein
MAWDRSSTFREQCRTLGAAGAFVIVQPMTKHNTASAISWIGVAPNGITVARVRLLPGSRAVELLAHEVEHVLERIEGVNYLIDARRSASTTLLAGGAFETRRAIAAGRRVAAEVHDPRAVTPTSSRSARR